MTTPTLVAVRGARGARAQSRRSRRRRVLAAFAAVPVLVVLAVPVLLLATPSVADAQDRVGSLAASHGGADRAGAAVPAKFAAALVATEDSRFYSHHGLDSLGVARAVLGSLSAGQDPGGSTLDQQLAKVLYTGGRSAVSDKIEQVTLAVKLDASYSKSQLLEMYAASVYFGHGFYGLRAASCGYFNTSPSALSWAQGSLLAGLVAAPSAYDPIIHPQLAKDRQRHVLGRLVAVGALTGPGANRIAGLPWGISTDRHTPGSPCP